MSTRHSRVAVLALAAAAVHAAAALHVQADPEDRDAQLDALNPEGERLHPRDRGCCLCHGTQEPRESGELWFTYELDAHVHPKCVRQRLAQDPHDPVATLIGAEFGFVDNAPRSIAATEYADVAGLYDNVLFLGPDCGPHADLTGLHYFDLLGLEGGDRDGDLDLAGRPYLGEA